MRKSKLPEDDIARAYRRGGVTQRELANQYGVSRDRIKTAIVNKLGKELCKEIGAGNIARANCEHKTGVPRPAWVKEKIGDTNRGRKCPWVSEKQKGADNHMYRRTGEAHHNYGKPLSEETKKKLSESLKGKTAWNKGITGAMSEENRKKISERNRARVGEKAPNWRGGKTSPNQRIRGSAEYKEWRERVFARDNYACKMCKAEGVYLHAHHVRRFSRYPETRLDVENGITLCSGCHNEISIGEGRKLSFIAMGEHDGESVYLQGELKDMLMVVESYDTGKRFRVTVEVVE